MEYLINNAKLSKDQFINTLVEATKKGEKVSINLDEKKIETDPREECGIEVVR